MAISTSVVSKPHAPRWHYALIIVVTSVLMLWQLGGTVLDGHEAFVAVSARNMADSEAWLNPAIAEGPIPANTSVNHWMVPVFNGEPRLVKTPLAYWCVAGLLKLGLPPDEFTARLPSALASIALAVLVLALGRSMFSPRAALMAALMLGTSLAFVDWGRNSRADMQMTLWMSVALACLFWALRQSESRKRNLLLLAAWGALGLANLAKQMAPMFILLPAGLYLCWLASTASAKDAPARRTLIRYLIVAGLGFVLCALVRAMPFLHWWRPFGLSDGRGTAITMAIALGGPVLLYTVWSRPWREAKAIAPTILPGVALMLLVFVPWIAYIANTLPQASAVFVDQTSSRALGVDGWPHRSYFPLSGFYIWSLAKWTLPWVIFLPGALAMPLMKRFRDDRNNLVFLFLWVFGLVLLFSVSAGKRVQYIIPAMPATCLLIGYCAEDVFFKHRWFSLRLAKRIIEGYGIIILAAAIAAVIALGIVDHATRPFAFHILILADLALLPVWVARALVRTRPQAAVAMMLISVVLAEMGYFTLENPWNNKRDKYASMGQRIRKEVPANDRILALSRVNPAIVWYSGRELPVASQIEARFTRTRGKDKGHRLWRQWLEDGRALWSLAWDREADDFKDVHLDRVGKTMSVKGRELSLFRGGTPSVPAAQMTKAHFGNIPDIRNPSP